MPLLIGDTTINSTSATLAGNLLVDTNTLFVDSANNRLGIGTTEPNSILDVGASQRAPVLTVRNDGVFSSGSGCGATIRLQMGGSNLFTVTNTGSGVRDGILKLFNEGAAAISMAANSARGGDTYFDTGGNFGIGTTTPTNKLTVNGAASFSGGATFGNSAISNFELLGYETNNIRPVSGSYGGFTLKTFDGSGAGYLLMRDTGDNDVYQQYGFTVVTDRGPLTLAARGSTIGDNSPRNFIRFMTAGGVGSAQVRMTISKDGHITTPYQPAFHAFGATATSGNYVTYPSVYVNRGSHYSTSTGRFTAPVAGYYIFFWDAIGNNNSDVYRWFLRKNGSTVGTGDFHLRQDTGASGTEYATNGSRVAMLNLAVNDYVQIFYQADNGTNAYVGSDYVTFGGYLLG